MMRVIVLIALLSGCAGKQAVAVETARAAACEAAEAEIERRQERGEIPKPAAFCAIDATRAVCNELHRRLGGEQ